MAANAAVLHTADDTGTGPVDPAILKLLHHRYGDGLVYLRGSEERVLYQRAVALGLINADGYLTCAGRSLITLTPHD